MQGPIDVIRVLLMATGLPWVDALTWDDAQQCDPHAAPSATPVQGPRFLLTGRGLMASGLLPNGDMWWFMASNDPDLAAIPAPHTYGGYGLMEAMSAPWDNSPVWAREMLSCGQTVTSLVELPY
jgi:hypothetical protein